MALLGILVSFVALGLGLGFWFMVRGQAEKRVPAPKVALPVVQPKPAACATCVHFDYALGQRELAAHAPFRAAMQHIPPWRQGRVLKTDENGAHLPLSEQGIPKDMLALTWEDMGACLKHSEIRAKIDKCDGYEVRPEGFVPPSERAGAL